LLAIDDGLSLAGQHDRCVESTDLQRRAGYMLGFAMHFSSFFFFIFNDFSETNYLKIRWTDFRNLFTE